MKILRSVVATLAGLACIAMAFALWPEVAEIAYARGGHELLDKAEIMFLVALAMSTGLVVALLAHASDYVSLSVVLLAFIGLSIVRVAMAVVESGDDATIRHNLITAGSALLAYVAVTGGWKFVLYRRGLRRIGR